MICSHRKVFSGERFPLGVSGWFWVCRDCHASGHDLLAECPRCDPVAYYVIMIQMSHSCWVPASVRKQVLEART